MPCYMDPGCGWGGMVQPARKCFRDNLRALIEKSGLKDHEFAKEIGVSNAKVSRWFNERNDPSFEDLDVVAAFFKVPVQMLFLDPSDTRTTPIELDQAIRIVTAHAQAGKDLLKS